MTAHATVRRVEGQPDVRNLVDPSFPWPSRCRYRTVKAEIHASRGDITRLSRRSLEIEMGIGPELSIISRRGDAWAGVDSMPGGSMESSICNAAFRPGKFSV